MPLDALLAVADKCRDRYLSQDAHPKDLSWIADDLWSPVSNAKAGKAITEFGMCMAARSKKLPDTSKTIKKIVTSWLNWLNLDANDSNLDIEVEKFVSLDEHSMLSYVIGHRLAAKVR